MIRPALLLLSTLLLAGSGPSIERGAYWQSTESAAPGGGSSIVWSSAIGATAKDGGLALICKAGQLRISVLPVPKGVDGTEVRYRFDTGASDKARFAVDHNRLILQGEPAVAFASGLAKARQAVFLQLEGQPDMMFLVDHAEDRALIAAVTRKCAVSPTG